MSERPRRVSAGSVAVVLVLELPDDLLDQVLEGDDAGGAAVLVGDDRELEALARAAAPSSAAAPRVSGTRTGATMRSPP